ncbi:MAG: hypothetical protein O7I93_11510 [Gemmatimonadetes bacterium]|nr:hypothetical protein [Gemmatimonadota bacterium]
MAETYLLISNPPHGEIEAQDIAKVFGFTPIEARMRVHFPAPEIWFASEDLQSLKESGAALQRAGAHVKIIKGSLLSLIPPPDAVKSFSFGSADFTAQLASGAATTLPYPCRAVMIASRPEDLTSDVPRDPIIRDSDARPPADTSFLDAFFLTDSSVLRTTIFWDNVDYTGLGPDLKEEAKENQDELVQQLKDRFPKHAIDDRLVDAPAPKPTMVSGKTIPAILEMIDPTLRDLTRADLRSRLAFLSNL